MKILAIETSCDETAISIVDCEGDLSAPQFKVLAHQVSSQVALHAAWGGVVPSLAKREHGKALMPILITALKEAGLYEETPSNKLPITNEVTEKILDREPELLAEVKEKLSQIKKPAIDAIAVTRGPGLEPALWVGINFAKLLSLAWQLPLVPTNHMEGHLISPLLADGEVKFPAIGLLISGGHTELILVTKWGEYEKIGQTRDDAVGEAFDKVARLLGLPYPGGPEITKLANEARADKIEKTFSLPRPMLNSPDYDFSFSGLKTAVRYSIQNHGELSEADKRALARDFEDAVVEVLVGKTLKALAEYGAQTLIIGGGVIANTTLRAAFTAALADKFPGVALLLPERNLSTDNATMIAMASYLHLAKNEALKPEQVLESDQLIANGNLGLQKTKRLP